MPQVKIKNLPAISSASLTDALAVTASSTTYKETLQQILTLFKANATYSDSVFRIQDNADATKEIAFEASGITTGTTRTLTMIDADLTLANMAGQTNTAVDIDGGTIDNVTMGGSQHILDINTQDIKVISPTAAGSQTPLWVINTINNNATSAVYIQGNSANSYPNVYLENNNIGNLDIGVNPSGEPEADNAYVWSYSASDLRFGTNNTLRAKITSAGVFDIASLQLGSAGVTATGIIDDDSFVTASAVNIPSSESVKAYVDSQVAAGDFDDSTFTVYDNADNTKKIAFQASGITTGTTRTLTMIDADLTLADMAGQTSSSVNIDGGTIDGVSIGATAAATEATIDNLKLDGNTLSSTNVSGNITLDPNGSGDVVLSAQNVSTQETLYHEGDTDTLLRFITNQFQVRAGGTNVINGTTAGLQLHDANARVTAILDEDDMSSDSATAGVTQQSLKSYIDAQAQSVAKVWSTVDWSGGSPVDLNSYGVSSLTDTAAGQVTINFTTSFADVNYSVVTSAQNSIITTMRACPPITKAVGTCLIAMVELNAGATAYSTYDTSLSLHSAFYGDI